MNLKTGLTQTQADELIKKFGLNLLPSKNQTGALTLFLSQLKNYMTLLLLVAALLSFFVGDKIDGLLILVIFLLNLLLGFWQEYKASKELEALKKLEVNQVRVSRDDKEQKISASYLVPGDIIILESGDKVPADAQLVEAVNLSVDESSLTGESIPVPKSTTNTDDANLIYFATTVKDGHGKALIIETGSRTRFGKIALILEQLPEPPTPLEQNLKSLAKKLALIAMFTAILFFIIRYLQGYELIETLLSSTALMVAAVPEGLPAIITIVLAIGVRRMYKHRTLVRKLSSVESLGATTVICTDKTGTLTKNEMRVKEVFAEKGQEKELLENAIFCNNASLVLKTEGGIDVLGDTTEGALLIWAKEKNISIDSLKETGKVIEEIPFDLKRKMMTVVWQSEQEKIIYSKGAPESILGLCNLNDKKINELTKQYEKMAAKGLRVLAFAKKSYQSKSSLEKDLNFLGFIGIADAARLEAKDAILKARNAGIKIIMITGDNELTAKAIGQEVGLLLNEQEILTGSQLDKLNDQELLTKLPKIAIFARATPDHKLRIVKALQSSGEIVAVTGDGVNDALALKQAHVGVAMGRIGTDVAKEAADIVILDDNLTTIITAIEQGRLIYSNILKVVKFLLAGNLAEVLLIVLAVLLGLPTPLLPVQILWINFVTDGVPAISLAADSASSHLMSVPPRTKDKSLLNTENIRFITSAGTIMGISSLGLFYLALSVFNLQYARSVAFTAVVVLEMLFLFVLRKHHSLYSNKYLFYSVSLVLFLQALILGIPELRNLFKLY